MTRRATITLDDDVYLYLMTYAGKNKSGFINSILRNVQQATLAQQLLQANTEEANDTQYQQDCLLWDNTLLDGGLGL
jgi:hypothetical protein